MYLMVADETNQRPSKDVRFFVYGGLLFDINKLHELDSEVSKIRLKAGYKDSDEFKFDTRTRPTYVSQEKFLQAKNDVVNLCIKLQCKFLVHIILHDIIANQDLDQQVEWAADYVIGRYNMYLNDVNDDGICVIDNLPIKGQFKYLSDKFVTGLSMSTGKATKLNRIKLFAASCVNASHANSAMDIVLGSFRYCINNPKNPDAAKALIGKVSDLLWGEKVGKDYHVIGRGVVVRPEMKNIRFESYKKVYDELFKNINRLLGD